MSIELEALKDKIAKLLAKAEGTDNPAEAEAFMAKVNDLLEQHQIGMHEVRGRTAQPNDPMGAQWGDGTIPNSLAWYRITCTAICRYYGCEFVFYKHNGSSSKLRYQVVGPLSSRTTALLMMPFIISQVRQASRKYMREQNEAAGYKYLTEVKAQTHVGLALKDRIYRLIAANKVRRADLESKALVPVDTLKQFMDEHFGDLKTARQSTGQTTYEAIAAAAKISLHTQTEHSKARMLEG